MLDDADDARISAAVDSGSAMPVLWQSRNVIVLVGEIRAACVLLLPQFRREAKCGELWLDQRQRHADDFYWQRKSAEHGNQLGGVDHADEFLGGAGDDLLAQQSATAPLMRSRPP